MIYPPSPGARLSLSQSHYITFFLLPKHIRAALVCAQVFPLMTNVLALAIPKPSVH